MKILKHLLFAFFIVITLLSCKGCKEKTVIQVPLTIATFEKLGNKNDKFPPFFEKLCDPYETNSEIKTNFAPYPIAVKRLDLPNGDFALNIIADEKKSNTNSLSYRKNIVKKYFQDNILANILTQESANVDKTSAINSYISSLSKKSKVFFFSVAAKNNVYNNSTLYDDTDSLINAISKYLSEEGKSDIVIILNPEQASTYNVDTDPSILPNTDTNKFVPPIPIIKSDNEFLRKTLLEIVNTKLSFDQRISKVNEVMKTTFSKDLVVETYINKAGVASHLFDKGFGRQYLENLARDKSIIDFSVLAHKDSMPNISYLQVIEIHKQ